MGDLLSRHGKPIYLGIDYHTSGYRDRLVVLHHQAVDLLLLLLGFTQLFKS